MIWYSLVLLLSVIIGVLALCGVAFVRSKIDRYQENSVIDLFMDFPKTCICVVLAFVLFGTYEVKHQLHEMWTCGVRSTSQNVNTQYSWYFDKCRFQNKDGVWVDMDKVRSTPEGSDAETDSN